MRAVLPSSRFDMSVSSIVTNRLSQPHGPAAFILAALGGIHEGKDLERFLVGYGRLSGFKELHHLYQQRTVAIGGARWALDDLLGAKDHRAIVAVGTERAHGADAAVLPAAHDDVGIWRIGTADFFAARTHQRIEQFDGMDGVPGELELVMRLQGAGA